MADAQRSLAAMAFNGMPIEINQHIALYLDDYTLSAFSRTCHVTFAAIYGDRLSYWRAKFRKTFDFLGNYTNKQLYQAFRYRAVILRRGTPFNFHRGDTDFEARVVKMLRTLIVESFLGPPKFDEHGQLISNNQYHLLEFARKSGLINQDRRAPQPGEGGSAHVRDALAAVQLVCFHFVSHFVPKPYNFVAFDEAQFAVYQSSAAAPIFSNNYNRVNLQWLLHCMNFFRHHMLNEEYQTLYYNFKALDEKQKPSAWRGPLRTGAQPLPRYWRGTYGYLHEDETERLRRQGPSEEYLIDKNIDEGKLQSLQLSFAVNNRLESGTKLCWPRYYEETLNSLRPFLKEGSTINTTYGTPNINLDAIKTDSLSFEGTGADLGDRFMALGWVNPLPPQGGIPGWQRFTMMKAFNNDYGNHQIDNIWAYEGVVLPGNRIILGRWWFASEPVDARRDYIGPFILWAADEPEPKPDIDMNAENTETQVEGELELQSE